MQTRAWISAAPGVAQLQRGTHELGAPGANELLVEVSTAALNFSDLLMIDDRYQIRPPRPFVPGQEIVGTVLQASPCSGFAPGERIASKVTWGGFAGHALVRADMALKVPGGLTDAEAAALPVVYPTAMVALTESTQVRRGDRVLVLAASGGVGLAAVQIARALGATVIAAAGGDAKCRLAVEKGAHEAVDYRTEGWSATVKALSEGHGVDVVVDPVGGPATQEALRALAWEGRLLVVGFASGEIPQIPANRLLLKRASAIGVYWSHDRDPEMLARVNARLAEMAASGALRPHVGASFAFAELPQALAALAGRQTTGKVVLNVKETE